MPGRDGTGPYGMGPNGMELYGGRRLMGRGFGRMYMTPGFRRFGCRYDLDAEANVNTVDEITALKANAAYLEMKLKEINKRIETLT